MPKCDEFSYEELLMGIFDISDAQYDLTDFDALVQAHFAVGFTQFQAVVDALLPLIPASVSPVTGKRYHALIKNGLALLKIPAES